MKSFSLSSCELCPRRCKANRETGTGFCQGGSSVKLAKAALHHWEEPCISGTRGSGTVFFSGCPLRCCFCQNYPISSENFGAEISVTRLSQVFLELQEQGAHNINLVNPTHYVPWILEALELARPQLRIPLVYNSGGYERVEILRELEGVVDIYLPDLKFYSSEASAKYARAPDYFSVASKAILEMYRQVGRAQYDAQGLLKKGLIIRHLAMPSLKDDSIQLLRWIHENLPGEDILVSVMSQYLPCYHSGDYPEINRRISTYEYRKILEELERLGFSNGYTQQREAAVDAYIPDFDLSGVFPAAPSR